VYIVFLFKCKNILNVWLTARFNSTHGVDTLLWLSRSVCRQLTRYLEVVLYNTLMQLMTTLLCYYCY